MSKRRYDNGPGPIPKRWLNCPIKCDEFVDNKFIAFKTPLSEKFDSQVPDNSFYLSMIFDYVKTYYKVSHELVHPKFSQIMKIIFFLEKSWALD